MGPVRQTIAPWIFGGELARTVYRFKARRRTDLARPLARLLWPALETLDAVDVVVPVPLHRQRLRKRRYNQAALLARHVAARIRRPLATRALRRERDTPSQRELPRIARQRNMANAFRCTDGAFLGHRVLLVDDVVTTGATAAACTQTLVDAGAKCVTIVAVARAVIGGISPQPG